MYFSELGEDWILGEDIMRSLYGSRRVKRLISGTSSSKRLTRKE